MHRWANFVEQNLVGIPAIMLFVFLGMHMMRHRAIMWRHDVLRKTRTYCNGP